ncbi:hypothetical protein NDU88_001097 [Pleurodeles waltl]|uniref:Uncharacterized protein n=1 Tax=Pleurodeles waltl TaxID=8319 RepID=A0AAV7WKX5_PLEWA|nr:hypothetical protein NDU88_001097 [Pleurodeles waltl]
MWYRALRDPDARWVSEEARDSPGLLPLDAPTGQWTRGGRDWSLPAQGERREEGAEWTVPCRRERPAPVVKLSRKERRLGVKSGAEARSIGSVVRAWPPGRGRPSEPEPADRAATTA